MASEATWNPSLWEAAGGRLPEGWRLTPLGGLLESPKSIAVGVMYPGDHADRGVPLVRVGDVQDGGIVAEPQMRITADVHREYRRTELRGDELLITLVGKPGACVIARPGMKGWNVARALAVARLENPALRPYLKATLESSVMKSIILGMLNTTVQPTLNLKEIKWLPVPVPDDPSIAESIGAFAELFSERIALLRQTNATLESVAQALFKSWFINFDPVRAKAEGREPEGMDAAAAALFPDEFEESALGLIPKGWLVAEVGQAADCVGGGTPSTKEAAYWEPPVHHWATPKDLSGLGSPVLLGTERCLSPAGLAKVSSGLLPAGTLLMSSRAPIGYLAITQMPVAVNQGFIAIRPDGLLPPEYLYFWCQFNMEAIKRKANGSTFMEISKSAFRPIPLVLPSKEVVAQFAEVAGAIFARVAQGERQRAQLAGLRDTLLPRLISGKLRLPEAQEQLEDATA